MTNDGTQRAQKGERETENHERLSSPKKSAVVRSTLATTTTTTTTTRTRTRKQRRGVSNATRHAHCVKLQYSNEPYQSINRSIVHSKTHKHTHSLTNPNQGHQEKQRQHHSLCTTLLSLFVSHQDAPSLVPNNSSSLSKAV